MIVLFGCKRVGITEKLSFTVIGMVTVSIVFACLFSTGCKKHVKPVAGVTKDSGAAEMVITNRMNDPVYVNDLKKNLRQQMDTASAARAAVVKMNEYKKSVKEALPPGTDEVTLERILSKDEVWLKLKGASEQAHNADSQTVSAARARVRQAMIDEARAREAVVDGKAKAIDRPETK